MTPRNESWSFRIRGTFTSRLRVSTAETELILVDEPAIIVKLQARRPETALKDTEVFTLRGIGYSSATLAKQEAEAWWDRVMIGFAANRIGADFGIRNPLMGGLNETVFQTAQQAVEAAGHGPIKYLNERSGILVHPTESHTVFIHGSGSGYAPMTWQELIDSIQAARAVEARMSEQERLAYDLYAAALSMGPSDARILMLSTALETLITQKPRPESARALLERLIEVAKSAAIEGHQRDSIIGTLKGMHSYESIGQAGRHLATTLSAKDYGGRNPEDFFKAIYALRSKLVHGHTPRPTEELIRVEAGHLERFVSDLLTKSLRSDH